MTRRLIIVAFGAVLISLLCVNAWLFGENELPSSLDAAKVDIRDWQTFVNQKYGYSLQHPPDWNVDARNGNWPFEPEQSGSLTFDGLTVMVIGQATSSLEDYVNRLWIINKEKERDLPKVNHVSELRKASAGNEAALMFSVSDYFVETSDGPRDHTTRGQLYYLDKWGYRFLLILDPASTVGITILSTLNFTPPRT